MDDGLAQPIHTQPHFRVQCLTFRRRLLLCLVESPRSRALSDADGPWMEKVSLECSSNHFVDRTHPSYEPRKLNKNPGQALCAIYQTPHVRAVHITPSGN